MIDFIVNVRAVIRQPVRLHASYSYRRRVYDVWSWYNLVLVQHCIILYHSSSTQHSPRQLAACSILLPQHSRTDCLYLYSSKFWSFSWV